MLASSISRFGQLSILAALLLFPLLAFFRVTDETSRLLLATSALVSAGGFLVTRWLVPRVGAKTASRGICGKDLNKRGTAMGEVPIPEAGGLAVGCVFLLCIICFELLHFYDIGSLLRFVGSGFQQGGVRLEQTPEAWLVDYNAAMATICFMLFLGFADDVLDIRWRVKLVLPLFAALPLLAAYSGGTGIAVPKPLQAWLGVPLYLELGILYKVRVWTRHTHRVVLSAH